MSIQDQQLSKLQNFLNQWEPLVYNRKATCPPDSVLVSLAQGGVEGDSSGHTLTCEACRKTVELLRESLGRSNSHVAEVLQEISKLRAEITGKGQEEPAQEWAVPRAPAMTKFWHYASYAGASFAVILALGWGWISQFSLFKPSAQSVEVVLDVDTYAKVSKAVDHASLLARDASVAKDEKWKAFSAAKVALDGADGSTWTEEQVMSLNQQARQLQSEYNKVFIHNRLPVVDDSILARREVETDLLTTYISYKQASNSGAAITTSRIIPIIEPQKADAMAQGQLTVSIAGDPLHRSVSVQLLSAVTDDVNLPWIRSAMQDFADRRRMDVSWQAGGALRRTTPRVLPARIYTRR